MGTAGDVRKRVAALVGDPDMDWLTAEYFFPLLNQAYDEQVSFLTGTCSPFLTKNATLLNLQPGESDLTKYAKDPSKALYGLVDPKLLWWKVAGQPENWYQQMRPYNVLPDVVPQTTAPAIWNSVAGYEWRGNYIFITPFGFNIDLRVRGDFNPPPLTKDEDLVYVHPRMVHSLAYGTAALLAAERGNDDWVTNYGAEAKKTLYEISRQMVQQQQKNTARFGRVTRGGNNFRQ